MKTIITIIIIIAALWGGYALMSGNNISPDSAANQAESGGTESSQVSPDTVPTVKEFTVVAKNFSFSPSTMKVNLGDKVRIIFQNQGGNHDWVIDEFGARTAVLSSGETQTIEFVADKAGSFEYYCSVGTHRQMGMKGALVVE